VLTCSIFCIDRKINHLLSVYADGFFFYIKAMMKHVQHIF